MTFIYYPHRYATIEDVVGWSGKGTVGIGTVVYLEMGGTGSLEAGPDDGERSGGGLISVQAGGKTPVIVSVGVGYMWELAELGDDFWEKNPRITRYVLSTLDRAEEVIRNSMEEMRKKDMLSEEQEVILQEMLERIEAVRERLSNALRDAQDQ